MSNLYFDYKDTVLINDKQIKQVCNYLMNHIDDIKKELKFGYNTKYAFLNLANDFNLVREVNQMILKAKNLKPRIFLLIGIGGSNLGTLGLFNSIFGNLYNLKNILDSQDLNRTLFYCADTIDDYYLSDLIFIVERELKSGYNVLINIVSKSGKTIETSINAYIFIDLIKKYKSNYQDYIFVTTDKDSLLYNISKKENYNILEIPKLVGGRFSVLSAVGLFPIGFFVKDFCSIEDILVYHQDAIKRYLSCDLNINYALISASITYFNYQYRYKNISDLFIFSPDLKFLGSWYRQLVGESLGKKFDNNKNLKEVGITPTISIATIDLHSVVQLYLAGPRDKTTTFLSFKNESNNIKVDSSLFDCDLYQKNLSITFIKNSILNGVKSAYQKDQRPFMSIELREKNLESLIDFMVFKMLETIYIGTLFNINVFDQPEVELYKQEAEKFLKNC
ncbi:glucose-6-phosphate isomerase [Candidatus Babela massiliensis]|uniref:Glucose-6-phosphate isomerase n=1 Tax=Candidatus Babela massiliensis TaxID=673862 RepID=V6DJ97_9BACT|nr:glucose-6-phosphate isomerase [Candidatus Babela massiliensis]CDK30586.1 Glucose-6-phosphate isomerase [Candidatus Babela massiliensis]